MPKSLPLQCSLQNREVSTRWTLQKVQEGRWRATYRQIRPNDPNLSRPNPWVQCLSTLRQVTRRKRLPRTFKACHHRGHIRIYRMASHPDPALHRTTEQTRHIQTTSPIDKISTSPSPTRLLSQIRWAAQERDLTTTDREVPITRALAPRPLASLPIEQTIRVAHSIQIIIVQCRHQQIVVLLLMLIRRVLIDKWSLLKWRSTRMPQGRTLARWSTQVMCRDHPSIWPHQDSPRQLSLHIISHKEATITTRAITTRAASVSKSQPMTSTMNRGRSTQRAIRPIKWRRSHHLQLMAIWRQPKPPQYHHSLTMCSSLSIWRPWRRL